MAVEQWTDTREFISVRVTGNDPADIVAAIKTITDRYRSWYGEDDEMAPHIEWSVDGPALVIGFLGTETSSLGW